MTSRPLVDGTVRTRLRAAAPQDAVLLAAWRSTPGSPFEDWGGPPPPGAPAETRCVCSAAGGLATIGELVIADAADRPLGTVTWHPVLYGPNLGSQAFDIGISLRPESRSQGHGARAQRMLASLLFTTTSVHRVQASTDVTNIAEHKALARAGFAREGVVRGAQWRQGSWHDLVTYARLRDDL